MKKCSHGRSGYLVRARGGVLFRWCADCGAAGVAVPCPGREPIVIGWVRPGADSEQRLEAYIDEGRELAAALEAGAARVDSPRRPSVGAPIMRGEGALPDRAVAQIASYDHDAPPGEPPTARAPRARRR